jgi:hypothetical protein
MVGHESKNGASARHGKRKVPVLAEQMNLFPRFKVPALNKPPGIVPIELCSVEFGSWLDPGLVSDHAAVRSPTAS